MFMNALNIFLQQFFTKPEVLLALIVMVGYILLKIPIAKIITGTIKTAVGVMILLAGASYLTSNFVPVLNALKEGLNLTGVINDPYTGMTAAFNALGNMAQLVGYTLLLGFVLNMVYVKYFKARAVFLTGHVMLQQSSIMTWMVLYLLKFSPVATVLLSGFILSLYWAIMPTLLIKPVAAVISGNKNDTSRQDFTTGHQQMVADYLAFRFGHLFGNWETENVEKIKLPGWLAIFQDNIIATSVVMVVFISGFALAIGETTITKVSGGQNWMVFTIFLGIKFAVAITIILTGVRMFIGELVPAFKGISEKWLPGAVPAIDCPALFPFSPKAVTMGFMFTVFGQVIGVFILIVTNNPIAVIPGFIPMFFDGGPVAVFANAAGGWKAVVGCCTILGVVHILGTALVFPISGLVGGWLGNFDWVTLHSLLFFIFKLIGPIGGGA
jgi:ascorbate PTS system EIIC component